MTYKPPTWNGLPVPYEAGVEALAGAARGGAPACWAALIALGHHEDPRAADVLIQLANDAREPDRRAAALRALGDNGHGAGGTAVILAGLTDSSGVVARGACEAAGKLGLREARAGVLALLDVDIRVTRLTALEALKTIGEEQDVGRLEVTFRSDTDEHVRREAAWTMRALAREGTWRHLFDLWCSDAVPRHRQWACELAARHGGEDLLGALDALQRDHDGHVRMAAVRARAAVSARLSPTT